jgi:hypothetical protein
MFLKKIFNISNYALLTALTLSVIAAWYSIQGLMAIFAAAVIPIIIMGGALEIAKVVTTVWLHYYWDRATWAIRLYLMPAVIVLALITSMGIFGYLSKAHMDQAVPSGDVAAQVSILDEKIKTEHDNIDASRKALQQMDQQVDQMLGRTDNDKGAERAVQIRRQQAKERNSLQKDIQDAQSKIVKLNEERAPIASKLRKVEAEVGPIKYIAALIYGDNPDQNLLERAVRWVIIILVLVFDPLALCLVIAAITSKEWDQEGWDKEESNEGPVTEEVIEKLIEDTSLRQSDPVQEELPKYEPDEVPLADEQVESTKDPIENPIEEIPKESAVDQSSIKTEGVTQENPVTTSDGGYVKYSNKMYQENALKQLRPDLSLQIDTATNPATNFGTTFPSLAKNEDVFVRVDVLPNKVFKFDGGKWIELSKSMINSTLYNTDYIQFLIDKLDKGEYDVANITEVEAAAIEEYLKNKK